MDIVENLDEVRPGFLSLLLRLTHGKPSLGRSVIGGAFPLLLRGDAVVDNCIEREPSLAWRVSMLIWREGKISVVRIDPSGPGPSAQPR